MDDPLQMAAVDCLTELLEHLKDQLLVEKFVFSISLYPLQQVASLTVLHYDEELFGFVNVDRIVDLYHVFIINPSLNLYLQIQSTMTAHTVQ